MFVAQMLILVVLLLALYGIYRMLMNSELPIARVVANVAGASFAVLTCVLVLFIRPMVLDSDIITSNSMRPTLRVGDRVFTNKLAYRKGMPGRGDIITFRFPSCTVGDAEDILIKRVIGVAGDTIEVRNAAVYRNGKRLDESYIKEAIQYEKPAILVPQGQLFVLGDNRNVSDDSHIWGVLDGRRVIGKATIRFWPMSRIGSVR